MFYRILLLLLIVLFIISFNFSVEPLVFEKTEYIEVEVRGAVLNPGIFKLERGSNFADLKELLILDENADLSSFADLRALYQGDLLSIPYIQENKKISINNASLEELDTLPGIGIKTAEKIIAYRQSHGGFKTLEEIQNVSGIKEKTFAKLKDLITL